MPTRSVTLTRALFIIGLIAAILFIAEIGHESMGLRVILKSTPLLSLIAWVLMTVRDRYALLIVIGLIFSLAGDILLEISDDLFVPGLIAFLLGHVWYIAAFLSVTRQARWWRALPFIVWVGLAYLILLPNLKGMAMPVAAYVVIIGAMMWRASATADSPILRWQWLALIGAILFGLSDTLLALKKFNSVVIGPTFIVIVLYWLGQLGIGLSTPRSQ